MRRNLSNILHKVANRIHKPVSKAVSQELKSHVSESDLYKKTSYAQCGEDLIIEYIFALRGVSFPSYIDIGAHHPWFLSNTALFYLKGCRGINIEPNPNLINLFNKDRPEDINLNIGIGETKAVLDFYDMSDNTLSTFSKQEVEELKKHGFSINSISKVQVNTLNEVLSEYYHNTFPHLLTVDVEGLELSILTGIDYKRNYPKIICVETAEYSPKGSGSKRRDLIDFISSQGYYLYADTNLNSIFVKDEFWFL